MKMKKRRPAGGGKRQLNIRLESELYTTLQSMALNERRSVPQTAKLLLEKGLLQQTVEFPLDDLPVRQIGILAASGGGFRWLEEEPDLYDDASGEPL